MKEVCQALNAYLLSKTAFTDVMSDRLFLVFASEGTAFPFTTYIPESQEGMSKDADTFMFQLYFWFAENKTLETMDFLDAMKPIIEEKYDWISSTVEFNEENRSFAGIINFKTL